jgi:hypothetical protein
MGLPIRFCRQRAAYAIDANTVIGGASGHPPRSPEPGGRRRVNAAALPDDYMARTRRAAIATAVESHEGRGSHPISFP